jgi:Zn-dependent peptidase ImmA (M78 family)
MALPEINLARRLVEKRKLTPPIDIVALARNYATVSELDFPVEVDGICLDLKQHGKRPRIFFNRRLHKHRRRFTLAHELGHILIPWHVGSIVDETETSHLELDFSYWQLEAEANRFASELLMPSEWAEQIVQNNANPGRAAEAIAEAAEVSFTAALIKAENSLPKGYVYARFSNGMLISSGRSPGTMTGTQGLENTNIDELFQHATKRWEKTTSTDDYYWWYFSDEVPLANESGREWREIFTEITDDIGIPPDYIAKFKQRISGVLSSANSASRNPRTAEAINSACIQRLYSSRTSIPFASEFIQHPKLSEFLAARIADFLKS